VDDPAKIRAVRQIVKDFKGFALSGNVVDLAIGIIIGVAFGAVVESFAKDILLQLVAAIVGTPNFDAISVGLNGTEIHYGKFLTVLVNFLIIASALLIVVKLLMRVGMNFRAQGNRECDYCKSFVPVDASKCMYCASGLEPVVPG
jgi:large conductance mechanosensitive channel